MREPGPHTLRALFLLWLAGLAVGLVAIARSDSVREYRPQPVNRVIDPLMRSILLEMDLTLRSVTPQINEISPSPGGSGQFKDASFVLYDDANATKRLQFQLSGLSAATTRTLTAPNASGTLPLIDFSQKWTGANYLLDDRLWIADEADTSRRLAFSVGAITTGTTRTLAVPDESGTLPLLGRAQTWSNTNLFTGNTTTGNLTVNGALVVDRVAGGAFNQRVNNGGSDVLLYAYDDFGNDYSLQVPSFAGNIFITFPPAGGQLTTTTATQTLTNKTLNSSTIGVSSVLNAGTASGVTFRDPTTTTKQLRYSLSGLAAATVSTLAFTGTAARTWTLPDASITLAGSASALTAGRVPIATTGGLLTDDADFTFDTDSIVVAGRVRAATSLRVGSGATVSALNHGTYTPTRSAESNLDANVTLTQCQWLRVGNTVTVSGRFTADPTLAATATSFELTLPVASNFGAAEDAAGVAFCGAIAGQGAEVTASVANDTLVITWLSGDVTSQSWSFTATYEVI